MGAKKTKIGVAIGLVLALFGLALLLFFDKIIFYGFEQELPLKPGSESYRKWRLTPIPLLMKIYFWNWTNPHLVGQPNYKPSFVEMGPYVFREVHEKVNETWNQNGTITYRIIKRWYFDEEKTKGSLSDNVTSVNAVAASVAYLGRSWSKFVLYPLSMTLVTTRQELHWTKNVSQLLFEGFENSLQSLGSHLPGFPVSDKFGWFYKKNGTVSGDVFNIATGTNNLDEIGELKFWNYKTKNNLYPECPNIEGSSGEFWPPKRTKKDPLPMYSTDMCRKINFYFEEESNYEGIDTFVYGGTKKTVDNGSIVRENKCYYDSEYCPPSGVFDVSKCQFGAPIFISYPHFYNADPYYRQSIEGMNPDPEKHRFFIALEPRTGIQVDVAARMQVNIFLKRNPSLSLYRNVQDVFIPVFWLENHVSLGEEYIRGIRMLIRILELSPIIYYGMFILGCLIIVAVILLHFVNKKLLLQKKRTTYALGSEKEMIRKTENIQMIGDVTNIKEVEYSFSEIKL